MSHYAITIARGFGSGGKQVGIRLSKELGIPFYDREILQMASDDSGLTKALFSQTDERLRGSALSKWMRRYQPSEEPVKPESKKFVSDDNLFRIQEKIIRQLTETESCIIIGRCADHILKDYDNVASIYIEAPKDDCVKSIMDLYGINKAEARDMISNVDKHRADYYKFYSGGREWTDPTNYDMTLNSVRVGRENCCAVIRAYLKIKGYIE